jgi:4-diphosphocytidyl-2-C-methyl-D-erythritol kinase
LLIAPGLHVSTPEAYRRLSPRLTTESQQNKIFSFQSHTWDLTRRVVGCNDFESVVMEQHPRLATLKEQLARQGASDTLMTGSGSAVFGLFPTARQASRALANLAGKAKEEKAFPFTLVTRARYRSLWWRALEEHITRRVWPPQSRN